MKKPYPSSGLPGQGIIAVYKPKGPTSHDIIDHIRDVTGQKTVGHAGTLDPLASGVLVVGIGRPATKKLQDIVGQEKEYIALVRLGMESATDDEEGEKTEFTIKEIPSKEIIEKIVWGFIGVQQQTPPPYSAVKINGKPAYKYARQGKTPTLRPRTIEIKNIEIMEYTWPNLKLRIACGPGTYIRTLARDIGKALGTGAYLADLERTRVGLYVLPPEAYD